MAYMLGKNGKPYYTTGDKVFPCSVSAEKIEVEFKKPVKKVETLDCIYTEDEIKKKLGIKSINVWDESCNGIVKRSNKIVSSIQNGSGPDIDPKPDGDNGNKPDGN